MASKPRRSEKKQGIYAGRLILVCLGCVPRGDPNGDQRVRNEELLFGRIRPPWRSSWEDLHRLWCGGWWGACRWGPGCLAPVGWVVVVRFGSTHGYPVGLTTSALPCVLLNAASSSAPVSLCCRVVSQCICCCRWLWIKLQGEMLFCGLLIIFWCWRQRALWPVTLFLSSQCYANG